MIRLKSESRALFDEAGLPELEVGRGAYRHLHITTLCGKSVVQLTNYTIGTKLTAAERKILIEDALKPVLKKHKVRIREVLEAGQVLEDARTASTLYEKELVASRPGMGVRSANAGRVGGVLVDYILPASEGQGDSSFRYTLYLDGKSKLNFELSNSLDPSRVMDKVKELEPLVLEAVNLRKALRAEESTVDTLTSDLRAKCRM